MRCKKYNIGGRIFYETWDGCIESDIVLDIEDDYYETDKGDIIKYQSLITWRDGNCSTAVEDYNCLSPTNPKVRELAKKYAKFDKHKDEILDSIIKILEPYDNYIKQDVIKLLESKII